MTGGRIKKDLEKSYVVDASVAVKWFSREKGSAAARHIFKLCESDKLRLFASDLIFYEVGNALGRGKRLEAELVRDALFILKNSSIEFLSLDSRLIEASVHFMEDYAVTFYDAVYAAIAYEWGTPLLSANPKDHTKIKKIKVSALRRK